ncbi:hypothetical protein UFOVP19_2 [uncultured Caudovirales phage]|uniref:Uncharacterized protein n=1 Tax=uncultured Caudovirales phage TaxID=2100421 RepID=A0A6J5KKU5_9CAUD|nr:hypothetical protein UFOVP19_2 [uncultured Caudovirales phage]
MIHLTKGETNTLILTLTEKQTLTSPNYLFVFTNRSSNNEIKFVVLSTSDTSLYKNRYNKFSIITDTYFKKQLEGQYTYQVYEQASTTNTIVTGLNKLESGIMWLSGSTLTYNQYTTTDTYTIRQ